MEHTIINAAINYIWYPLACIYAFFSGQAGQGDLLYQCGETVCGQTVQLVIAHGTCTMKSGAGTSESDISGRCTIEEGQLEIHESSGTVHAWKYREGDTYIELYDSKQQVWIRLVRQ